MADDRTGVGHQRGDRQSDRAGTEQHAGPDAGPLSLLQLEFHHILFTVVVLHPVHHHGIPLLEHIQGKSIALRYIVTQGAAGPTDEF